MSRRSRAARNSRLRAASIARVARSIALPLLAALATGASFGESLLDPTFGAGGIAAIPANDPVSVTTIGVLRDGSSIVAFYGANLSRLSPNGGYDASFGARAGVLFAGGFTTAIAQDRNGRLIVANGTSLARVADDGHLDTSFGTQGISSWNNAPLMEDPKCRGEARITSVEELPDGKLALFGYTVTFDGFLARQACILLARTDSSGRLDTTFAGSGATAAAVLDRASLTFGDVLPDGSMRAIGMAESNSPATGTRSVVWTVDALGRPVSLVMGEPHGLQQPDGSSVELLLQDADTATQKVGLRVRKVDGSVDTAFGNGGESAQIATNARFYFVRRLPDGGVVALGYRWDLLDPSNTNITYRIEACAWRFDGRAAGCEVPPSMDSSFSAFLAPGGSLYVASKRANGAPGAAAARFNVTAPNVEFFNTLLKHYFVTYDGQEARGIDNGGAGEGWVRTGQSTFKTGGTTPVCRFYGTPGIGSNSHFFTVSADECELVKRDVGWTYEGIGFYATPAVNGQCAAGLQPVYRLYNQRGNQRDSNHRHITDLSLVPAMQAQGWAYEGVALCAPG
jgi:hypothetical protein